MSNQKLDNQLNLAINASMEEREKSLDLNVGFDEKENVWDVIVKYSGDIRDLTEEGVSVVPLLGNYGIVTIVQNKLQEFSKKPQVEFIEKPKRLFFAVNQGKTASCIREVQSGRSEREEDRIGLSLNLTGKGILVGIVDSGIDVSHFDFRNGDGSTRILRYWDQSGKGIPPEGYLQGVEYTDVEINDYLRRNVAKNGGDILGSDNSGHGTAVLGIAAGNGQASNGRYRGIAYESEIIAVKLGIPKDNSFPRTTELIQGVDYLVRQAMRLGRPMVINLSFGNNYGSHRGDSLVETYLDTVANMGRLTICVGTGNNGNEPLHTNGRLQDGETQEIELGVSPFESFLNIQLWKNYADIFDIYVEAPSGERIGPLNERLGPQRYPIGDVQLLIYYGKPGPFQLTQEIYFDFIPQSTYVESGVWKFILVGKSIKEGEYEMWLPGGNVLNPDTGFFFPRADGTLTIPATARRVISVGAYDSRNDSLADFSGRGGVGIWGMKPDLVAPGVDIMTTTVGGGYESVTGTSFATPFVSGAAALLMEWGIVQGNDPYLYGEKVKAYLQRGARILLGYENVPNPETGWGALCLKDSFPE